MASAFTRKTRIHGGSIIFCKKELEYRERCDITKCSSEIDCEISAVEILSMNLIIVTIYRSPSGDLECFLALFIKYYKYYSI